MVWNSELVPVPATSGIANSYNNTIWSASALTRYPLLNPEPVLNAVAVLTQVLDQAAFSRLIPTGSQTIYAAEFKKSLTDEQKDYLKDSAAIRLVLELLQKDAKVVAPKKEEKAEAPAKKKAAAKKETAEKKEPAEKKETARKEPAKKTAAKKETKEAKADEDKAEKKPAKKPAAKKKAEKTEEENA